MLHSNRRAGVASTYIEFERSEKLYLVTCDHNKFISGIEGRTERSEGGGVANTLYFVRYRNKMLSDL